MFSFFRKKTPAPDVAAIPNAHSPSPVPVSTAAASAPAATAGGSTSVTTVPVSPAADTTARAGWLSRLRQGLRRTGQGIAEVFTGKQIDDELYESLESALLMADAGVPATEFLLNDLKRRV